MHNIEMDSRSDGNLMPFKMLKRFFKSTIEALCAIKNNSIVLKTYSQSNVENLGVCTVRSRNKDKAVRCRLVVVPGDGQTWLGMPDIELLGILKMVYEVVGGQQADGKFDSQTIQPSSGPSYKSNQIMQISLMWIQTCQIISSPAATEQQTKG